MFSHILLRVKILLQTSLLLLQIMFSSEKNVYKINFLTYFIKSKNIITHISFLLKIMLRSDKDVYKTYFFT